MAFALEERRCGWRNALITGAAITRSLDKLAEKIGDDSVLSPQVLAASIPRLIPLPSNMHYSDQMRGTLRAERYWTQM